MLYSLLRYRTGKNRVTDTGWRRRERKGKKKAKFIRKGLGGQFRCKMIDLMSEGH